jgi:pimeloyl-ACP methyl ester carboxylesterase
MPLLRKWANESQPIRAVACDLRGYSPKASPSVLEEYLYETLATDVFAIADAAGFNKFHLVGHDHGAGLGWLVASMDAGARVLSWSALSVPHVDAFSTVLFGPEEDEAQVVSRHAVFPTTECSLF